MLTTAPCPCGSGRAAGACCMPFIEGRAHAPTAEALMRARYTAWVLERFDYLRATWHPATCPAALDAIPGLRWLGLSIRRVEAGGSDDARGVVEFVARSKQDGRATRQHETSHFARIAGRWVYVRGEFDA
ncbi:MAG: YchJ family metal-binding protein [Gammaproteobacteria bacterium]